MLADSLRGNTILSRLYLCLLLLAIISVGNNGIGEEGCKTLCELLKKNHTITAVYLSTFHGHDVIDGNSLGEAGCGHVGEMLATNSSLSELYLGANAMGDAGCKHLAQGLAHNSGLREIYLSNCCTVEGAFRQQFDRREGLPKPCGGVED